jgi:tRNA(fMet)-specific endonuclease VapC
VIFLPDTDAFSVHLRGTDPGLSRRLVECIEAGRLRFSVVVSCELAYGAAKAAMAGDRRPADRVARLRKALEVEPLSGWAVDQYAQIRADLERRGELIGAMDLLLAAHAMALGATLVTANTREFTRVRGLRVENWRAVA